MKKYFLATLCAMSFLGNTAHAKKASEKLADIKKELEQTNRKLKENRKKLKEITQQNNEQKENFYSKLKQEKKELSESLDQPTDNHELNKLKIKYKTNRKKHYQYHALPTEESYAAREKAEKSYNAYFIAITRQRRARRKTPKFKKNYFRLLEIQKDLRYNESYKKEYHQNINFFNTETTKLNSEEKELEKKAKKLYRKKRLREKIKKAAKLFLNQKEKNHYNDLRTQVAYYLEKESEREDYERLGKKYPHYKMPKKIDSSTEPGQIMLKFLKAEYFLRPITIFSNYGCENLEVINMLHRKEKIILKVGNIFHEYCLEEGMDEKRAKKVTVLFRSSIRLEIIKRGLNKAPKYDKHCKTLKSTLCSRTMAVDQYEEELKNIPKWK